DITVKGVKSIAKKATGSLLVVDAYGNATLGADALLTDNTAVEGGGARLVGNQAELIISGGRITNCLVSRNGNTGMGGGVYVHGGSLTMISGEITDNNANLGGVYVDNYEGTAGSALLSSTGRIYLYGGSQITRNQAQQGGGVYTSGSDTVLLPNDASTATIAAYDNGFDAFSSICCISVTGNTASSFGGGWMAEDCTLTIDGAEVTGNNVILRNNSGAGGGVYLASSVGTISNLHLFNCNVDQSISSSNSYDDVYSSYSYNYYPNRQNGYRGRGGGAYFESCNVTMTDSVFEKNGNQTKEVTGVALAVRGGTLTATNVLFSENGKQDIKNSSGYLDSNGYAYGTLHVGSSANFTLNLCTFTKCYAITAAPSVWISAISPPKPSTRTTPI
ncbi:MAG: hypothetical protein IJK40_06840, partial [Clostridia bacterium]|nr:hypothetical protein [Clostridia bacterium]